MLRLQIATPEGAVVNFPAGGPVEADLTRLITEAIKEALVANTLERGVGFLATSAHVEADLRSAIDAVVGPSVERALYRFKDGYRPFVG